jgi:hypothetical protein
MRYVILLTLILCGSISYSEILFEDDFESGKIDKNKWTPQGSWVIKDNADDHDVLGKHVIEIQGGDVGLSVDDFPKEFDYYADFKAMQNGLTGFVFHGTDAGNIYMHQVSTSSSGHTPQHIRWHRRVNGGWAAEPGAFEDGVDRDPDVWYRAKFEVRSGHNFKAYIGPVGGGIDELSFVSEWTDSQGAHSSGKIGFRKGGAEQAQYDNIIVVTPDFNPTPVEPMGKAAVTWGNLKRK